MSIPPLFGYPGGKRRTAPYVWRALGNVGTYCEPFGGSMATLLARPAEHLGNGRRVEIVNDLNGHIVNLYRACANHASEVYRLARGPRTTIDMQARLKELHEASESMTERLKADPVWCDPKLAAWGLYLYRYNAHASPIANGGTVGRPSVEKRQLSRGDVAEVGKRLRHPNVLILCDDWSKAVTPALLGDASPVGVFLDPPYLSEDREDELYYGGDGRDVATACRQWAIDHGRDPRMRIVLAGYADEGAPPGWTEVAWASGSGGQSRHAERLWLSPHCLIQSADPGETLALQGRHTIGDTAEPA